ncbi:MAG: mevalonate kinase [archaeon]|nr:mevalonate kinase [archaeon]
MNLSVTVSAPGKFVILGEHSVVYGKPALALAMDMRFTMHISESSSFMVNGLPATPSTMSPHMKFLSDLHGGNPLSIRIESRVPSGSGLGSSAALSAAYAGAVRSLNGLSCSKESIAKDAYEAEYAAQGRGSPMDTSASVNGGGIALNVPYKPEDFLWRIEKNERVWDVSRIDVPKMTFVIGNTGIRAATGPLVEKVKNYMDSSKFARDIIDEMGDVTLDGMKAIKERDITELGALMTYDHELLSILGVSCPELDKLVKAALPTSYGAKLTGSGGGGCMVALTDQPEKTADAIEAHGGTAYIVSTSVPGVTIKKNEDTKHRRQKRNNRS